MKNIPSPASFVMMDPMSRQEMLSLMGHLLECGTTAGARSLMWSASDRTEIMAAVQPRAKSRQAIGVIPVTGAIELRSTFWGEIMGGTSIERFNAVFDAMVADPAVSSIVLDMHSPGGTVWGTPEAAAKIYAARSAKPIIAVADAMMASAAYYLGAAAHRVYVTPSGDIGSVGVYAMHADYSGMMAQDGVKVTIVKSDQYKAEGNPYEPMSEQALQNWQEEIDATAATFRSDVAKFRSTEQRKMTAATVKADFGQGRTLSARKAVEVGMADGVATFEQVIRRLANGSIRVDQPAAADDWSTPLQAMAASDPRDVGTLRRKLAVDRRN